VKLARLLLIVALFGLSCSIARADGTDPKVLTSGCGGVGEPACDPVVITSLGEEPPITFQFDPTGSTASVDIVNWTDATIGTFILTLDGFATVPTEGGGTTTVALSYECGSGGVGAFGCTQVGGTGSDVFEFDALPGGALCSLPPAGQAAYDILTGLASSPCQYGEVFTLQAVDGDPNLANATVGATIFAPEPSSAFLLLIGLGVGAFGLRRRSVSVA